ncbi:glycosyltransferase [Anabaena sp. UHCC 0451]|uniref:glycosyltransferase n=1 Tax=Anabaena sp. UHCC 0451 TaxID=2055235 RepID=UPI002B1F5952|nr:glycosyltransferase [Anabaena sp. UHCC 0451]MEA5577519.1 glycosyltransferase [Anabaena sp. UHCC 0451]
MKSIILTFNIYDGYAKVTSHHFAEYLINKNFRVLYVSDAVSPFHLLKLDGIKTNFTKIIRSFSKINNHQNFASLIPFTFLPVVNTFPFNLKVCSDLHVQSLSYLFHKNINSFLGNNKDVDLIWINNPKFYGMIEKLKYKKLVYSIEDDLFEFSRIPKSLKYNHEKLIQKADVVTVTSTPLLKQIKSKFSINEKLFLLRNGVSFDQFNQITDQSLDLTPEFQSIPQPRITYIGVISEWFDLDLLYEAAKSLPNFSFVIIGPVEISIDKLKDLSNIYFLGYKPHSILQMYLQKSQIGIIPFLRTKLIESVNPIKLYEYMATGLPVVSTTWSELEDLDSPAFLAKDNHEFIEYIKQIVAEPDVINRELLVKFAQANTWENRFTELMKVLDFI